MDHIAKIAAQLPEYGLDAMLITSAPGERYAVGFEGEGWVLVSREGAHYSTDGRYIEAARKQVTGTEIVLAERGAEPSGPGPGGDPSPGAEAGWI